MDKRRILGLRVSVSNLSSTTAKIVELASASTSSLVCVADTTSLMTAYNRADHRAAFEAATIVTTDGMPLVWLLKALGASSAARVSGTDLVHAVCGSKDGRQLKHYFYGGNPGVCQKIATVLSKSYGLTIVGMESPPFRALSLLEAEEVRVRMRVSQADIIWVGLGCPKQERWMLDNVEHLNAVLIGVGAAFDFISGEKRRAPRWLQALGLEWAHRLVSEPKRLWHRYYTTLSVFIPLALAEIIRVRLLKQIDARA